MNTLTGRQADAIRHYRKFEGLLHRQVSDLKDVFLGLCDHNDVDDDCPVCQMYLSMHRAEEQFEELGKLMDAVLERGPV